MVLVKAHQAGWEEWRCPACERRFLVQWLPACKMVVLEPGDLGIWHDIALSAAHHVPDQSQEMDDNRLSDEFRLIPWMKWMEKVDFDRR